jgi:membrane protease YdiL (CAAX protease family)
MRSIKNIWRIIFIIVVALFLPVVSSYLSSLPGAYIDGNTLAGGITLTIFFYSLQAGVSILLGCFILHISINEIGFNLKNVNLTLRMLGWFVPIWLLFDILFYAIGLNCINGFDAFVSHYYVIDKLAMQKDLFIGCVLAGMGEEPIFRGFVVASLVTIITKYIGIGKVQIPLVAILSGILFALAHIEYQVMPFRILYIDGIQLSITFLLGTFWSVMFIKTKSLLGPIIAHMCANIIQIMSGYLVAYYIL